MISSNRTICFAVKFVVWVLLLTVQLSASSLLVLEEGQRPNDSRLGPLRGERGDFGFHPPQSVEAWRESSEEIRRIMMVSLGLWPLPTPTPLNPVIHGRVHMGDYTLEKVYFESFPGFFVTGNLYRPLGMKGPRPTVLSPHGHFPGGRFIDEGQDEVRRRIVRGGERFENGGRSFMQARCVQLARMGCVVFHYDMIGYGDSQQISLEVAHKFPRSRVPIAAAPQSGLYSADAELRLQSVMGLHTYNGIRALDFLETLSDVDMSRLAVTGGSGGGTQTFMLCAVDSRPLVSVPAVIVGATRQGGCTCEHTCGLRWGTYNLDFTALHAPKPMLLISADDSTRTMPENGFPELQQLYTLFDAKTSIGHRAHLHFPHNYNYVSRSAMYQWINRHLDLREKEPIVESDYHRLSKDDLTVWNESHPSPPEELTFTDRLLEQWKQDTQSQIRGWFPSDMISFSPFQAKLREAWRILLRHRPDHDFGVSVTKLKVETRSDYQASWGLLRYQTIDQHQAAIPMVLLKPLKTLITKTVLWVSRDGKAALFDADGGLKSGVRKLIQSGVAVIGLDLLYQGEFLLSSDEPVKNRILPGEDAFASWTYCYNLPLFAQRTHDILAAAAWAQQEITSSSELFLFGIEGGGLWCAAALAVDGGLIDGAAIDTEGFRFSSLTDIYDASFVPGSVRYLDVPGLLSLAAPDRLLLAGEDADSVEALRNIFRLGAATDKLSVYEGADADASAVDWVLNLR